MTQIFVLISEQLPSLSPSVVFFFLLKWHAACLTVTHELTLSAICFSPRKPWDFQHIAHDNVSFKAEPPCIHVLFNTLVQEFLQSYQCLLHRRQHSSLYFLHKSGMNWILGLSMKVLIAFLSVAASLISLFDSLINTAHQLFVIFAQHSSDLCLRLPHRSSLRSASPHVSRPACQGEGIWTRWQLWMPCTSCSRFTGGTWIP